jgi:hypothetical protein
MRPRDGIWEVLLDISKRIHHAWDPILGNLMLKLGLSPVALTVADAADGARACFDMTMTIITTTTPMRGASG